MFLGFYGAEVIKVESESLEANREPTRPLFPDMNRAKLSCTIDLRSDVGKELFRDLARKSDVVVDNFSATVMKRLGLGYEELSALNPGIIQIGMPGMGTEGPLNNWVTYGNNLQAVTGLSLLWGHPDSPMQNHAKGVIPDYVGAALVALATAAALEHRDLTGRGQHIEIAQVDGQGQMMGPAILDYTINNSVWGSVGYEEPMAAHYAPFGAYPCRYPDTWIVIACETDEQWRALAEAMGAPDMAADPRFADTAGRRENHDEIDHEISEWAQAFTTHQVLRMLQKVGVPVGIAMNGEDLYHDPHLRGAWPCCGGDTFAMGDCCRTRGCLPSRRSHRHRRPSARPGLGRIMSTCSNPCWRCLMRTSRRVSKAGYSSREPGCGVRDGHS